MDSAIAIGYTIPQSALALGIAEEYSKTAAVGNTNPDPDLVVFGLVRLLSLAVLGV
ncbi:MAG TPA: hypothetical protein VGZ91_02010 [Candidatus Sulfotelmatobacter sp.]|jgi:hypothetical protein|nr:hypothetical protein [Candidatus Sulfotelmatobacter sp.]